MKRRTRFYSLVCWQVFILQNLKNLQKFDRRQVGIRLTRTGAAIRSARSPIRVTTGPTEPQPAGGALSDFPRRFGVHHAHQLTGSGHHPRRGHLNYLFCRCFLSRSGSTIYSSWFCFPNCGKLYVTAVLAE